MLNFKKGNTTKKDAIQYWHVYYNDIRIGYVYISESTTKELGTHKAINVFVNRAERRRGYGWQIFKHASILSGYKKLYSHSSKSNIGSYHAAVKADYKEIKSEDFRQRMMIWRR